MSFAGKLPSRHICFDGDCVHFALKLFIFGLIFHGCRLCLGAWSDHGDGTGGFYACNRYQSAKMGGMVYFILDTVLCKKNRDFYLARISFSIATYSCVCSSLLYYFAVYLIYLFSFMPIISCNVFLMFQYDEAEARRERAKNSLERYMHYYERWASNQTVCLGSSVTLHSLYLIFYGIHASTCPFDFHMDHVMCIVSSLGWRLLVLLTVRI